MEGIKLNIFDQRTLIRDYAGVWHPNLGIREQTRDRLRHTLAEVNLSHYYKIIDHIKPFCLMELIDVYERAITVLTTELTTENHKYTIREIMKAMDELQWMCQEIGQTPKVEVDECELRRKTEEKTKVGTLQAYGC